MTPSFDTLGNLRRRLAVRLGFGAQADALGIQAPILDDFLQSAQVYLCRIIRWRHLQRLHVEDLGVDQRVMDLPDDCLIDGIHRVLVLDAGVWRHCAGVAGGAFQMRVSSAAQQRAAQPRHHEAGAQRGE